LNFEDDIIDSFRGRPIKWLWMFLFHTLTFVSILLIIYAFGKEKRWLSSNSHNIWGGIFIYLGVAWLMELFG